MESRTKDQKKKLIISIIMSFLLSSLITFFLDFVVTFSYRALLPTVVLPVLFTGLFLLFIFVKVFTIRIKTIISLILVIAVMFSCLACFGIYRIYAGKTDYSIMGNYYAGFSDKRVMVVVPHQDDDINLVGGVIENYIESGSEVYPVFITNGDAIGKGEQRLAEAINCWSALGVPEDHVFFLGYGDTWAKDGPHIYNAEDNRTMISADGRDQTYGIPGHPAYHNGNAYTRQNLLRDLVSVILEIKPDVIFASDYDAHQDHRATSLFFEKAMGIILREHTDYHPIVYKGYAYTTAWEAKDDFYSINIRSTTNASLEEGEKEYSVYNWEDRVRFPVSEQTLSRSVFRSSTYDHLACYASQYATSKAVNIINGDKVFWQRRTDSLLYNANLSVTSGEKEHLLDFCILDSSDVLNSRHGPFDGVWTPDLQDSEKTITVDLPEKDRLAAIVLYDNPSPDNNILNAVIRFDDGTVLQTGALNSNGAATTVSVDKADVKSFSITIAEYKGAMPGLAEIEAFSSATQDDVPFIKMIDENGDFAYDYYTDKDVTEFGVYSNADIPALSSDSYRVSCDHVSCDVQIIDGKLRVTCPAGEECRITLSLNENVSDTIRVYHANAIENAGLHLFQTIEEKYVYPFSEKAYYNLAAYRLIHDVKSIF